MRSGSTIEALSGLDPAFAKFGASQATETETWDQVALRRYPEVDRIQHVHFSDGDGETYALHYVIGNGNLDLASIVQALKSIDYSGTLTNDMFNNPDLDAGARENLPRVQAVLSELGLNG